MKREVNVEGTCYLLLDWKEIDQMVDKLADTIGKKPFRPNLIIGVLRGGAMVAILLSDRLSIHNVRSVGARLYKRTGEIGEEVDIFQPLTMDSLSNYDVLLVEDVVDTGTTLNEILVRQIYPRKPRSLCTVSLHFKPWTRCKPAIYIEETESWILYPWETCDTGRSIFADLCKSQGVETARKILSEKFRLQPAVINRIVQANRS